MEGSILNKITVFVWKMFLLNMLFAASNVILIGAILIAPFHLFTLPLYIISAFFLIASLLALMSTLKRLREEENKSTLRLYLRCYKEEFPGSFLFSIWYILGALVLVIGYFVLQHSAIQMLFLPIYFLLAIILYIHFVYASLIRVNYYITIKSTWRMALYCVSKHALCSLFIFGCSMALGALMISFPVLIFLAVFPAAAYLLTVNTRKIFENITIALNLKEGEETNESENDSKQEL